MPVDPEFLLAAACCRWPPGNARDGSAQRIDRARFQRLGIAALVEVSLSATLLTSLAAVAAPMARAVRIIEQHQFAIRLPSEVMRQARPVVAERAQRGKSATSSEKSS